MHTMRVEFEDLGFKAMHPMRAERIRQAVKKARGNRRGSSARSRSRWSTASPAKAWKAR